VFTSLKFDGLGDEVFRDLVIARVVEPTPLLDAGRVLRDLGQTPASYATMKRSLGRAATGKYRDQVATWCFQHASTDGDVSLVLYDVTTLYFEAEKEDELRKVGYSKERRVDPQIVVGLLVARGGFPLDSQPGRSLEPARRARTWVRGRSGLRNRSSDGTAKREACATPCSRDASCSCTHRPEPGKHH
jgi:hypothetical protein